MRQLSHMNPDRVKSECADIDKVGRAHHYRGGQNRRTRAEVRRFEYEPPHGPTTTSTKTARNWISYKIRPMALPLALVLALPLVTSG